MNNNTNVNSIPENTVQNNNQQVPDNKSVTQQVNQQLVEQTTIAQQPQDVQAPNQNTVSVQPVSNTNQEVQIQSQLQSIPTVEQNKQDFINNVQSMNTEKKEEKKEGINFIFIIILFVAILVAIYFLFPLLLDYI